MKFIYVVYEENIDCEITAYPIAFHETQEGAVNAVKKIFEKANEVYCDTPISYRTLTDEGGVRADIDGCKMKYSIVKATLLP